MDLLPHIYHEKASFQEPGSMLCGQHALNNLLQSALFSPQDLAEVARQLDALEAAQLDPGTRMGGEGESQNYDDSGFFSIQVMEEALKVFGLRLVRWGSKEMASVHNNPECIEAFLLNHQLHWFSIRRFGPPSRFYNLDSCISAPQWISEMYLGLTLREAELQGYTILAVVPLPDSNADSLPACPASQIAPTLPPPSGTGLSFGDGDFASSPSSSTPYFSPSDTPFNGQGHSLGGGGASSSSSASASRPFTSALNPNLNGFSRAPGPASSATARGKRPASDEDDDEIIIEEPGSARAGGSSSVEEESERRRRRRKIEQIGQPVEGQKEGGGGGVMGLSEEEMMAAAIEESLRVSRKRGDGGGAGASQDGASASRSRSRAAQAEEEEYQRALEASLAEAGQAEQEEEQDEDDVEQEDSPSMEELRRRRLARFGG
ncbi:hypothetical protein JCM5296_006573 [Sporobolomyces johnsonii]